MLEKLKNSNWKTTTASVASTLGGLAAVFLPVIPHNVIIGGIIWAIGNFANGFFAKDKNFSDQKGSGE